MRILVTGASGFVGSLLVPKLCSEGHAVRALGRDPQRVHTALAYARGASSPRGPRGGKEERGEDDAEVIRGDVLTGEGLSSALQDVEVAYYLIHSIERSGSPFPERDRAAASNFAAAAARAGVERIVYLGGLLPRPDTKATPPVRSVDTRLSRHLASREEVERILLAAVPDSLTLRASIIIGARSRSFRLLVHLLERMPVLPLPGWQALRTQPIDERDVIAMLTACATAQLPRRTLDIGGPEALTYGEMLEAIAELMLVHRPTLALGVTLTGITARVAAAITREDPELVVALMESLQSDLLPANDRAGELLGVRLHSFNSAVEHALAEWERYEPLAAR